MALFGKKKQDLPSPPSLSKADLPDIPTPPPSPNAASLYSEGFKMNDDVPELPETPDELPEFPGRKRYTYEPSVPPADPQIPQKPSIDVAPDDMDDMIEQKADSIMPRPDVLPSNMDYPEEQQAFEDVQQIEEDEYEIEQDMIESLKETRGLDFSKPLFVLVDNYRCVLEELSETKNVLKNSEDILFRANELKNEMDKKYELWRTQIDDVQRKLVFVDKTLFEGGGMNG